IASANVFTAIVFASPGTPSTRRGPRARSATTIRSSSASCPTMTRLTWYSTCSSDASSVDFSFIGSLSSESLLGWCVGRATGRSDRNGEADPEEVAVARGVRKGGDDADHLTTPVEQRAAG